VPPVAEEPFPYLPVALVAVAGAGIACAVRAELFEWIVDQERGAHPEDAQSDPESKQTALEVHNVLPRLRQPENSPS
jgi:hypothetical protein